MNGNAQTREYAARAKLNLVLDVTGRRPDGYHTLDGVMLSVTLADTLRFTPGKETKVICDGAVLPEVNTVSRAAALYMELTNNPGFTGTFALTKRIPMEAGLGGGSADGAAALMALQEHYGALGLRQLFRAALKLGADVPFCLLGGMARAEGIGEKLTPLPRCKSPLWFVIAKPKAGVSTKALFSALDLGAVSHPDVPALLNALAAGDVSAIGRAFGNALYPAARAMAPEIGAYRERLLSLGALGASMTGSGSAVFGLFPDERAAREAREKGGFDQAEICSNA